MKLTPLQTARLTAVTEAARAYRYARQNLEAELRARLRAEMEAELSGLKNRQDQAAFRAAQAGVPKSRIGIDGLLTKNPQSATEAINAGRVSLEGTLEDAAARDALLDAAVPIVESEPHINPLTGRAVFSGHPFAVADDAPGWYVLTGIGEFDGLSTRFRFEGGRPAFHPDDTPNQTLSAFMAPPFKRLRDDAAAFVAGVEARQNA